jgi:hypothetical protein
VSREKQSVQRALIGKHHRVGLAHLEERLAAFEITGAMILCREEKIGSFLFRTVPRWGSGSTGMCLHGPGCAGLR